MRFYCAFLLCLLTYVEAWFENCDVKYEIAGAHSKIIVNDNYPGYYSSGSSCKWQISAPTGYFIQLRCVYNLTAYPSQCPSQRLYVSRDADPNLDNSEFFCGNSEFTKESYGNDITFGYTSNIDGNGWFYCEAKSVLRTHDNCHCGWSRGGRIIGGTYAQPNEYISMVGIVDISDQGNPNGPIFCGGAIISEYFILTAAHCFNVYRPLSDIYSLVGDHDISKGDDTPYAELYETQKIIKHNNYIPESNDQNNDIALIQTKREIKWKQTIGPACLPYAYYTYDNYFDTYPLVALGWGSTEYAGPSSSILKKTSLYVVDSDTCNQIYGNINSGKICTHAQGTDTCQRDSGGSLYWTYGGNQFTIGIVSYGLDCASNYPAVNTRVTNYIAWIEQQAPEAFFCEKYFS